jgi:hypothetical protein
MLSDRVSTVSIEGLTQLSTSLYLSMTRPIQTVRMTSLRPIRFKRRRAAHTVESLTELLSSLTLERQSLRASAAGSVDLERNRMAIAKAQWELSYALIERYVPGTAAAQSAA